MEWLTSLLPLFTTVLTKGDNMLFIGGLLLGILLGGAGAYIYLNVTGKIIKS